MRRAAAMRERERALPSPGPIGFRVRDTLGRSTAFELDRNTGTALVFGSASPFRVCAPGVLPAHFVVLPHDGMLVAASASDENAAVLNGAELPTSWTVLEVPARIRLGTAAVDFFYLDDSGTVLVDRELDRVRPLGPLPPPSPPPRRPQATRAPARAAERPFAIVAPPFTPVTPFTPKAATTPRHYLLAAAARAERLWMTTPMSTRVLLAVVVLLLIFLFFRGPRPA